MDEQEAMVAQTKSDKWRLNLEMGLPPDPCIWTVKETALWFQWVSGSASMYNNPISNYVVESGIDGQKICSMTEQEFKSYFSIHDSNSHMHFNRLQYWKTVAPFTPSDDCNFSLMGSTAQMLYSARLQRIDQDMNNNQINYQLNQAFPTSSDFGSQSKQYHCMTSDLNYFNDFNDISELYLCESLLQIEDTKPSNTMSQFGRINTHCNDATENETKMVVTDGRFNGAPPTATGNGNNGHADKGNDASVLKARVSEVPIRKRGRPPKPKLFEVPKVKKCHPILWKFLLESLNDPKMADCVSWVNKDSGVFKFESSKKEDIARKWGEQKGNRKLMTYQKMARALRDYGKKEIIRKHRRRLHYVFLPKYICGERDNAS